MPLTLLSRIDVLSGISVMGGKDEPFLVSVVLGISVVVGISIVVAGISIVVRIFRPVTVIKRRTK